MKKALFALMATTAITLSVPSIAAETPVPAQGIDSGLLDKMLGNMPAGTKNAISVFRDGKTIKVTIDIQQIAQGLGQSAFSIVSKPWTFVLTPQADGTLRETTEAPVDFSINYDLQGVVGESGSYTYLGCTVDGVFDPKISFFRDASIRIDKTTGDMRNPKASSSVTLQVGPQTNHVTSVPDADGRLNVHVTQLTKAITEKVHVDPAQANPAVHGPVVDMDLLIKDIAGDINVTGLKSVAATKLGVFVAANKDSTNIKSKQDEFKSLVHDVLPILDKLDLSGQVHSFTVQTPFGQGGAGSMGVSMSADTHNIDETITLGETLDGLTIDSVFVPTWSRQLIPTSMDLEFGMGGIDISGGLNKLVDALSRHDFASPEPDKTDYAALGRTAFIPDSIVHLRLKPSHITGPIYTIKWQGQVDSNINGKDAKVHVDVSATGIDDVIKTLATVHDKGVPETMIGLYAAKALAKPGPDGSLLWAIDVDTATGMLVNGKPVGPRGGKPL